MNTFRPHIPAPGQAAYPATGGAGAGVARPAPANLRGSFRSMVLVSGLVAATNLLSHGLFNPGWASLGGWSRSAASAAEPLFLIDKASMYVDQPDRFERKVREIASMLSIPPEWLMAVMYSESKFDASVKNLKGSGATGLIQFMPEVAKELEVSVQRLERMDHLQQLEYVYLYLQNVRDRYGDFTSLTDLYLGILYPRAIGQDPCYSLYEKPSVQYEQNAGLDENKDGRVTVSDIDRRMQRLYPEAYRAGRAS
ncbi:MAG: transglycosylase SLT domain-containing protein [Bacteroidia bacterium]|nr:transglycosylase SLT domain-containing protein [Bacteroidia bacterium]